ncbi:unnamed protein product [Bursaphelenchus xylophilus]|uniref:(pine wood nematode) hypothetical protein n=1 Tax=Bursaphelenchus xylophilus TaxID=6326 RepID=A0A1I7RVY0_BURXY|nr:unnamed protein product [Bursaphelenchus xylophilus]CAG9094863.1 unnamed protein product [Bursaphelenchus xylophilus]
MLLKIVVTLLLSGYATGFGEVQTYSVRGRITCDDQPSNLVTVRMYDYDKISEDDLMAEINTSEDGTFEMTGSSQELTPIEPYLRIYHHCGDTGEFLFVHCPLNFVYHLPEKGEREVVDVGTIKLRGKFRRDDEIRGCI